MQDLPMLSAEAAFAVDFNLHMVPAAQGLPVPEVAAAAMFGVDSAALQLYIARVAKTVRREAFGLLSNPNAATAIDRWALPAGGTVLAIGDSITTYRCGYARLLAAMLELRRPLDGIRFLNLAQSGYTSTHGLETTYTQFLARQPDWVLVKFGVNDCKRFGGPGAKPLVSLDEYEANIAGIVDAFRRFTTARIVLLTPTPVVEDVVNTLPDFQAMRMTWSNQDIEACAEVVRSLGRRHSLPVVDLVQVFGLNPAPDLFLVDGLHPNLAGHQIMLRHVLRALV